MEGTVIKDEIIRDEDFKITTHRIIQYSTEEYKDSEKKRINSLKEMFGSMEVIIDRSNAKENFYALEIRYININKYLAMKRKGEI